MIIIGADYHPAFQQIAWVDSESGELNELRLEHREGAEKFYRDLGAQGMKVRVGMEASGHARWFERLLAELHFELWIGDAAEIRTKRVRKQKSDRQDAHLLLRLLLEDRFPRIWVASGENRDLRQLLWHRHRMVQTRTRLMNQLQAVALNEGLRCKKRLWREAGREQLEGFRLAPWASWALRAINDCLGMWSADVLCRQTEVHTIVAFTSRSKRPVALFSAWCRADRTAAASSLRSSKVSSHPMQASVMLCPYTSGFPFDNFCAPATKLLSSITPTIRWSPAAAICPITSRQTKDCFV